MNETEEKMEKESDTGEYNLTDKGENLNSDPLSKVSNDGEVTSSQENAGELEVLPLFVEKTERPELSEANLTLKLVAESLVPEIGKEISIKTENEEFAPSVKVEPESPFLGTEPGDSFNDILLAEEINAEVEAEKRSSLLTTSTSLADPLATFSAPDIFHSGEIDAGDSKNKNLWKEFTRSVNPVKGHNLSVSELRRKLSVCPICQFQYSNYKLATVCLTKHGKRQCWLCLEVISSKRNDYHRHCIESHFVSNTGENVGCPFCAKFFDFRQGLNQHIVKIHFAESISDFYAVAALSPKTLVDIFTGQPREPSPISTPSESRESTCEDDPTSDELPLVVRSIFENALQTLDCSSGELPSPSPIEISSTIIPPPAMPLKDGVVCNRQAFPNLNKMLMVSSPTASTPRPSVITVSSRNSAQRMIVPPEQTMYSLVEESAVRQSGSMWSSIPFDCPHDYFQQSFLSGQSPYPDQNSAELDVEIVDNASLKFHPDAFSFMYGFGRNLPPPTATPFPPAAQMSRVTSDPMKYEMSFYPDFSEKGKLQEVAHSSVTTSYERDDDRLRPSYEKDIIQVNSDTLETPNSYEENAAFSSLRSLGSRPSIEGENELSCLSEAEKSYLDTITRTLESSAELGMLGFNSGMMEGKSNGSQPSNIGGGLPVQVCARGITDNSNPQEGNTLDPEIKGRYADQRDSQKSLSNCGVKRRILMKAMWEEQNCQFKRPAFPEARVLVHDLHTTSCLTQPVSSSHNLATLSSSPSNSQKVTEFKRAYNEVCFGLKARKQPGPQQPIFVSQGQVIQHAGPFFEQYVSQEKNRPREDPYKLLNLASTIRPPELGNLLSRHKSTSVATSWSNISGGDCLYPGLGMHRGNSTRPPGQWQAAAHSSTFTRPQLPTPHQLHMRKPTNTAFWDSLRARLMAQSSQKTNKSCTFSRSNEQPRSSCAFDIPKLENVTVTNPFEEEAISHRNSRPISFIPSLFDLKLGSDMNRFHTTGMSTSNKNMNALAVGNYLPEPHLYSRNEFRMRQQHQHLYHPFSGANIPSSTMVSHSCGNLIMGQVESPCNTSLFRAPLPPPPIAIYRARQQQQMMEQCGRLSHGLIRHIDPQSYNRYGDESQQGFKRF